MPYTFSNLVKTKENLFDQELVKYGIKDEKAAKVSQILASGQSNELLALEDIQLFAEACKNWLVSVKNCEQERLKTI